MIYATLIAAGVAVYEFPHHMSHCKVMIVDSATMIGSANLNRTSYRRHYEVAAWIDDPRFTAAFRRDLFERDLEVSRRIRAEDVEGLLDINAAARAYLRAVVMRFF